MLKKLLYKCFIECIVLRGYMKEASRIQAVIEIITEVIADKLPADVLCDKYFKDRRYIGSKDRRYIADLVWKIIRNRMKLSEMLQNKPTPRLLTALALDGADLALLFNGEEYAPKPLDKEEKETLAQAATF